MSLICTITLQLSSPETIQIDATYQTRRVQVSHAYPHEISDLIGQVSSGEGTQGAIRAISQALGQVLLCGDLCQLVEDVQKEAHQKLLKENQAHPNQKQKDRQFKPIFTLALSLSKELFHWPWELTAHPRSGEHLLHQGCEIIRVQGDPFNTKKIMNKGFVVSKASESFKFNAMKAATANISRRFKTSVVSMSSMKDLNQQKTQPQALFYHLYAIDRRGMLTLDQLPILLDETACSKNTYLLNITPTLSPYHHHNLRNSGAALVLGRQINLSVKASAESDRAFYHALGSGYTPLTALHWARLTLSKSEPKRYDWASLILVISPHKGGNLTLSPAFTPFPPTLLSELGRRDNHTSVIHRSENISSGQEVQAGFPSTSTSPINPPQRVTAFVHETIKLVQHSQNKGRDEDKVALALRTSVMKQLSAMAQNAHPPPQGLTRSEQLTHQLISAGYFNDESLTLPQQWYGRSERLAQSLGLTIDVIAQATQALIVSRAIWLYGGDVDTRLRVARGLCEGIFQSYPLETFGDRPLITQPFIEGGRELGGANGCLWEAAQISWAPKKSTPFDPQSLRPTQRNYLTAYDSEMDTWKLFKRIWLVVDQADQSDTSHRARVLRGMREKAIGGYSKSGRHVHLHLPKDIRVIYLSQNPPPLSDGEVMIELKPHHTTLTMTWTQEVRKRLSSCGLSTQEIESRVNQSECISFMMILSLVHQFTRVTHTLFIEAISYGILSGGKSVNYTEASEIYMRPYLNSAPQKIRECIETYAAVQTDSFSTLWVELKGEGAQIPMFPPTPIEC